MDKHWTLTDSQLKRLREIANGDNSMGGRHHRLPTMTTLLNHKFITIRTMMKDGHPYTGYFLTQEGAEALDEAAKYR